MTFLIRSLAFSLFGYFLLCSPCFAETIYFDPPYVFIAATSFEQANEINLNLPADNIISSMNLAKARADLICQDRGFSRSAKSTTTESREDIKYTLFEGVTPSISALKLASRFEYVNSVGIVMSFAQKNSKLRDEVRDYRLRMVGEPIPHLVFTSIDCEI